MKAETEVLILFIIVLAKISLVNSSLDEAPEEINEKSMEEDNIISLDEFIKRRILKTIYKYIPHAMTPERVLEIYL